MKRLITMLGAAVLTLAMVTAPRPAAAEYEFGPLVTLPAKTQDYRVVTFPTAKNVAVYVNGMPNFARVTLMVCDAKGYLVDAWAIDRGLPVNNYMPQVGFRANPGTWYYIWFRNEVDAKIDVSWGYRATDAKGAAVPNSVHKFAGKWWAHYEDVGHSSWEITPLPDGSYDCVELSQGRVKGKGTVSGNTLTITFAPPSPGAWGGIIQWTLDGSGNHAEGKLTVTQNPPSKPVRKSTLDRQ